MLDPSALVWDRKRSGRIVRLDNMAAGLQPGDLPAVAEDTTVKCIGVG